jgi:hypothetical protein
LDTQKNCTQTKKFYFQEINKIIYFPSQQTNKKYRNYIVEIKTAKTINKPTPTVPLGEFLETPELENNYPHTVGYFKESTNESGTAEFKPEYLEWRRIFTIEDFWLFLNAQNI